MINLLIEQIINENKIPQVFGWFALLALAGETAMSYMELRK